MIMHKPPSEHDEWLEENPQPKKRELSKKPSAPRRAPDNTPSGAEQRFKALNDDIQEYG